MENIHQRSRPMVIIGHPGHELRILEWISRVNPEVLILTDGSGANRGSRLESTRKVLNLVGAVPGKLFGVYSDRMFYELISKRNVEELIMLADRIEEILESAGCTMVVGDMLEGFSTTHDVCRIIINAVIQRLALKGQTIDNFSFALEKLPLVSGTYSKDRFLMIELDASALEKKRQFALQSYPEMSKEIESIISKYGTSPFRFELLERERGPAGLTWADGAPPYYEKYGAQRIADGHYKELITYRDHVQPIAYALWAWANQR